MTIKDLYKVIEELACTNPEGEVYLEWYNGKMDRFTKITSAYVDDTGDLRLNAD